MMSEVMFRLEIAEVSFGHDLLVITQLLPQPISVEHLQENTKSNNHIPPYKSMYISWDEGRKINVLKYIP